MTLADVSATLAAHALVPAGAADARRVGDAVVASVTCDSRKSAPGCVFVALRGQKADGSAFAREAVERGAIAVVSEQDAPPDLHTRWLQVSDGRLALAVLADELYGHPSRDLRVVGITGTNGKTTTAYLVASVLDAAGWPCGMLGTVGHRVGRELRESTHTTPEAPDVQALLREMVDRGCLACAMEVSSHALALKRVDGMTFAAGIFTNLTRDHLDFHADMEAYFQAKRRLFDMLPDGAPAVINADDPRSAALVEAARRPVTYGVTRPADVAPGPVAASLEGLAFDVRTPRGLLPVTSSLVGRPNIYNILAAVALALAFDLPFDAIARGVKALKGVPGRFEVVSAPADGVTVVVDYAHTDDALRNLLETARPLTRGRLITVFGCGGDRDRMKRPLMGAVAGRLSDVIVITSDNPRGEDPTAIIDQVRRGITPDTTRDPVQRLLTIPDRREAIARAIQLALPGDLVLIAGKGHEKYQVIGDRVVPFDDVAVARASLGRRSSNSGVV